MKTVLFIGVTGFLGQFWAVELLKRGYYVVFLARSKGNKTAYERATSSLAFVDADASVEFRDQYEVVEGDLFSFPNLDKAIDLICNASGATSFAEADREDTMRTNLDGTISMLEFASRSGVREIHFTSTAYVNYAPLALEDSLDCDNTYRNPYAESKCLAEKCVREWANNNAAKVFIYRPSIIVGHSKTGLTTNFFGYYRYMRSFAVLKNSVARKGVHEGKFEMPIHVPGAKGATINIVAVDYVVEMISRLHDAGIPGTYHITNQNPPEYEALLHESLSAIGVTGPSSARDPKLTEEKWLRVQERLSDSVEDYVPFVTGNTKYDQTNVRRALGAKFFLHPPIDEEMVAKLMGFALSCDFKRDQALKQSIFVGFDPAKHFAAMFA